MLQLDFKKFQEKLKEDKMRRPTLHYLEKQEEFILLFKNREYWEYYSVILKSDIISFGELYGATPGTEISDFKLNYLDTALELLSEKELPSEIHPVILEGEQVIKTKEVIDSGQEMVDEAEEYDVWFGKVIDGWERKVLAALSRIEIDKKFSPSTLKTFGEFMQQMMNAVNTVPFLRVLRGIIKRSMVVGLESAEVELDVQIGFGNNAQQRLGVLNDQQLDGYTINGKKWHGIRGATKQTQVRILKAVEKGMREGKSREELTRDVKQVFDGATTSQAKRIARTESNRFVNEGRLTAYKDSGVEGNKAYAAVMDKTTSPICRRLHNEYFEKGIPMDDIFIDPLTRKSGMTPPFAHPNCRCVVEFRLTNDS